MPLHPDVAHLSVVGLDAARRARFRRNNHLAEFAGGATSQHGEEGILDAIFKRLDIADPGWCVEFGACDGVVHSNTRALVHDRGWSAVYMEPFGEMFRALEKLYADHPKVHVFNSPVGWRADDGLDALLSRTPIPSSFDLLVIDIDGNDYHVWKACTRYRPKVVMIEFNGTIPPDVPFVVPPETPASASLLSLRDLGLEKGYELACVFGGNAIFVLAEFFDRLDIPDNHPTAIHHLEQEMRVIQGYDGTLHLAGQASMASQWEAIRDGAALALPIHPEDIQVLPVALRRLVPRLAYPNPVLDAAAGSMNPDDFPGNPLLRYRGRATSENGEDGILEEIFRRIGAVTKTCVEIGAGDGVRLSNTHRLIAEEGWSSWQVEADGALFSALKETYAANPAVKCIHAQATSLGIGSLDVLFANHQAPKEPDLLVIDVEGNDFHLWNSLQTRHPRVVMVDFNPSAPNDTILIQRDGPEIHIGSSLRAFAHLARSKGYGLAAVTEWNAIFLRNDLHSLLEVEGQDIDAIYRPLFTTKMFPTFDGEIRIAGCSRLIRQQVDFGIDDLQVLPRALRNAGRWFHGFGRPKMFYEERTDA